MAQPLQLLIVEDNTFDAELLVRELERAGFVPDWKRVDTEVQFLEHLHVGLDLVLSDYELPQLNGLRALELVRARGFDIPFILVSGKMGEEKAVQAMKHGATDYLLKDRLARLGPAVAHALEDVRLQRERLKAEKAKAQMQAQLTLLETGVARLNDIVLITEAEPQDEPGPRILFVNDAFIRRTGYSREEALGRSPRFLQGPKTSRAELDRIRAAMRQWRPVRAELINYTKGGEEFWLELDMVPVADAKGWFTHWVAVERDITERKGTEEVLRASERAQRALAGQLEIERARLLAAQAVAKVGSWETNFVTMEVTWSAEIFRIFETSPETFRPTRAGFLEFVHPEDRTAVDKAFVGAIGQAGPFKIVHRLLLAERRVKIVEENWQIFADDQGKPLRAIGTCQDITVRRQAEEALAKSEESYRRIVQTAQEGIWVIDAQARTSFVNPKLAEMLGYTREEMLGRTLHDFMDEEARASADNYLKLREQGIAAQHDFRFLRKDGSLLWTSVTINPIFDDCGTYLGALGMIMDVTGRKQAEDALRALARRLQFIREEERTGIAREIHDMLAQELTRLKLDLTWLARRIVEPVNELTRVELAQKVGSMIELADVTIESTQKLATDLRPVVLDSLGLGPAIEWLAGDFQLRTGIACAARVPCDLPALGRAQATAIFRIVQESLTNVIRHAAARHVEISLEADHGGLRLTVRDDGRGITPEELANPKSIGLLGMRNAPRCSAGRRRSRPRPAGARSCA